MSSMFASFLRLLVTVMFTVAIGLADRPGHGIRLHGSSGSNVDDQALQNSRDNQYRFERLSADSLRGPSDPDYNLLNLWNARAKQEEVLSDAPSFYRKPSGADDASNLYLKSHRQVLSSEAIPFGRDDLDLNFQKAKREGHSLSIVNPLEVLRQRMMLATARRRMEENQKQIKANQAILKTLGKRQSARDDSDCSHDDADEEDIAKRRGAAAEERRRSQRQDYLDSAQEAIPENFAV